MTGHTSPQNDDQISSSGDGSQGDPSFCSQNSNEERPLQTALLEMDITNPDPHPHPVVINDNRPNNHENYNNNLHKRLMDLNDELHPTAWKWLRQLRKRFRDFIFQLAKMLNCTNQGALVAFGDIKHGFGPTTVVGIGTGTATSLFGSQQGVMNQKPRDQGLEEKTRWIDKFKKLGGPNKNSLLGFWRWFCDNFIGQFIIGGGFALSVGFSGYAVLSLITVNTTAFAVSIKYALASLTFLLAGYAYMKYRAQRKFYQLQDIAELKEVLQADVKNCAGQKLTQENKNMATRLKNELEKNLIKNTSAKKSATFVLSATLAAGFTILLAYAVVPYAATALFIVIAALASFNNFYIVKDECGKAAQQILDFSGIFSGILHCNLREILLGFYFTRSLFSKSKTVFNSVGKVKRGLLILTIPVGLAGGATVSAYTYYALAEAAAFASFGPAFAYIFTIGSAVGISILVIKLMADGIINGFYGRFFDKCITWAFNKTAGEKNRLNNPHNDPQRRREINEGVLAKEYAEKPIATIMKVAVCTLIGGLGLLFEMAFSSAYFECRKWLTTRFGTQWLEEGVFSDNLFKAGYSWTDIVPRERYSEQTVLYTLRDVRADNASLFKTVPKNIIQPANNNNNITVTALKLALLEKEDASLSPREKDLKYSILVARDTMCHITMSKNDNGDLIERAGQDKVQVFDAMDQDTQDNIIELFAIIIPPRDDETKLTRADVREILHGPIDNLPSASVDEIVAAVIVRHMRKVRNCRHLSLPFTKRKFSLGYFLTMLGFALCSACILFSMYTEMLITGRQSFIKFPLDTISAFVISLAAIWSHLPFLLNAARNLLEHTFKGSQGNPTTTTKHNEKNYAKQNEMTVDRLKEINGQLKTIGIKDGFHLTEDNPEHASSPRARNLQTGSNLDDLLTHCESLLEENLPANSRNIVEEIIIELEHLQESSRTLRVGELVNMCKSVEEDIDNRQAPRPSPICHMWQTCCTRAEQDDAIQDQEQVPLLAAVAAKAETNHSLHTCRS